MSITHATFAVVEATHAPKFYAGCLGCGQMIGEGEWAIVMGVGVRHFMVGQHPRPKCCGKDANVPFLFGSKAEAQQKMTEVMELVRTDSRRFDVFTYFPAESFFPEHIH